MHARLLLCPWSTGSDDLQTCRAKPQERTAYHILAGSASQGQTVVCRHDAVFFKAWCCLGLLMEEAASGTVYVKFQLSTSALLAACGVLPRKTKRIS